MESVTLRGIKSKEKGVYRGLLATTHIDKDGEMFTKNALTQMKECINNDQISGGQVGSYRAISVSHDWIKKQDPTMDAAAYAIPGTADLVQLGDGHWGVEADVTINEHYRGDMSAKEIEHRIEIGDFAGFSVEFEEDKAHSKKISVQNKTINVIDKLKEYCGAAFARARKIANTHAILYKEVEEKVQNIENNINEETNNEVDTSKNGLEVTAEELEETSKEKMSEDKNQEKNTEQTPSQKEENVSTETQTEQKSEVQDSSTQPTEDVASKESGAEDIKLKMKEILQSKEFKEELDANLNVSNKVIPNTKEKMEENTLSISMKEMNESIEAKDTLKFKEARSLYFKENEALDKALRTYGVPLETTLKVKSEGTKLRIMDSIKFKDTLDTTTNPTDYSQNIAELADLYLPGLIDTFNNQVNYFGSLRKIDHMEGTDRYGWKIRTSRDSNTAVDPNDTSIRKNNVKKLKLQTPIKEYRLGVSVTDYMLYHSRGTLADLFGIELEVTMKDIMVDINKDLFSGQSDNTLKVMGLPAIADTATYTEIYGLTRTNDNRLAPDAAGDTYTDVSGAITDSALTTAFEKVESEGALRQNLKIVCSPKQRDAIIALEKNKQRYNDNSPNFGFGVEGVRYNGIPVVYDYYCPDNQVFVTDDESDYIVMSRPPQVVGLAKVGAAEEAYISTYLAHVYEIPRRIHMLDNLS